jgi:O-antigen ligase
MLQDLQVRHPILQGKRALLLLSLLAAAMILGVAAADVPVIAIAGELSLIGLMAILSWPDVATLLVIVILITNAAVVAVHFHGGPSIAGAAVPVLLLIPLASYLIFKRQKLVITRELPLIFLFLVVQIAGTLLSTNIITSTSELLNFMIEGIGLYFLIINVIRTRQMLRWAIWALLLAGACMGFLSLYQQLTRTYANNYWGFAQMSNAAFGTGGQDVYGKLTQKRLAGPLGDQNRYAQNMLMLMSLGMFRFWGERSRWLRLLALGATVLCAIGVALTFSRGAAVGFVAVLGIITVMRYIKPYQLAIIALGAVLLLVALPQYGTRLTSLQGASSLTSQEGGGAGDMSADGSLRSRLTENLAALLVFIDHPVVGVGPGMFRYYYQDYAEYVGLRVLMADRQAHELYLGVAAENGALGLICFLLILFVSLRGLARVRKRWLEERPELANLATGFLVAIISYMTTGLFLHFAYIRFFWLIMALAGAAVTIARQETAQARGNDTVVPNA